jgi:hypothetical protein
MRRVTGRSPHPPVDVRRVTALPGRTSLTPAAPDALEGKRCEGCNSSSQGKPGLWYVVGERPYCQDCAPEAAQQTGVDLARPPHLASPPVPPSAWRAGVRLPVKMRFAGMYPAAGVKAVWLDAAATDEQAGQAKPGKISGRILDVALSQDVELRRQRVRLSPGGVGRAVDTDAYLALTVEDFGEGDRTGEETGLAITPYVTLEDGKVRVDQGRWGIVHLGSGKTLGEGRWFANPIEAQGLVAILAQLDWRRDYDDISAVEKADAEKTIRAYHEALRHVK